MIFLFSLCRTCTVMGMTTGWFRWWRDGVYWITLLASFSCCITFLFVSLLSRACMRGDFLAPFLSDAYISTLMIVLLCWAWNAHRPEFPMILRRKLSPSASRRSYFLFRIRRLFFLFPFIIALHALVSFEISRRV
ncbi:hypothetical protein BJX61DRAFT_267116 [Aspergillus egyptiacus]|nr:hypothetical protein BJX61DRAFT_267116 [Aspergillus egyptiacus]